jgi:CRP/FNR family cyclic AMP-dependent transcriptional regulator
MTLGLTVVAPHSFFDIAPEGDSSLPDGMIPGALKRGDVLFRHGDRGDRLYLVSEGMLKLSRPTRGGREVLLDVFGPGDMLGELAAFAPGPWTATAEAVTDVTLTSTSAAEVGEWAETHPAAACALLVHLAERLRDRQRRADDRVTASVSSRVAQVLLKFATTFGTARGPVVWVDHGLSQEELAQMVGANRRTVNQALGQFSRRGWIHVERRRVVLNDTRALSRVAGPSFTSSQI